MRYRATPHVRVHPRRFSFAMLCFTSPLFDHLCLLQHLPLFYVYPSLLKFDDPFPPYTFCTALRNFTLILCVVIPPLRGRSSIFFNSFPSSEKEDSHREYDGTISSRFRSSREMRSRILGSRLLWPNHLGLLKASQVLTSKRADIFTRQGHCFFAAVRRKSKWQDSLLLAADISNRDNKRRWRALNCRGAFGNEGGGLSRIGSWALRCRIKKDVRGVSLAASLGNLPRFVGRGYSAICLILVIEASGLSRHNRRKSLAIGISPVTPLVCTASQVSFSSRYRWCRYRVSGMTGLLSR